MLKYIIPCMLVLVMLASGCTSELGQIINNEVCSEIVPDYFVFDSFSSNLDFPLFDVGWKNEYESLYDATVGCSMGDKPGRNINYLYCGGFYAHKKEIDEEGDILGDKYYSISLVLEKFRATENKNQFGVIIGYSIVARVVDYSCSETREPKYFYSVGTPSAVEWIYEPGPIYNATDLPPIAG